MLKLNHLAGFGAATETAGATGGGGDPYWANVVTLIQPAAAAATITEVKGTAITNNGVTLNAGDTPVAGIKAMAFDGTASHLILPDSADFDFTGDFTWEVWVKLAARDIDNGSQRRIMASQNTGNCFEMVILAADGGCTAYYNTGGSQPQTATVDDGGWRHLVIERLSGVIAMARDGVFSASLTKSATLSAEGPLYIGRRAPADGYGHFSGLLGGLRLTRGAARYGLTNFTRPGAAFPTS